MTGTRRFARTTSALRSWWHRITTVLAVVSLVAVQALSLAVAARPAAAATSHTIWDAAATPQVIGVTDNQPIELGVRFSSDVDGSVSAIRFYKAAADDGVAVGHLWTADGTQLAEATFAAETASGWQEVTLTPPVAITAGVTYVASYWSPTGYFSDTPDYFKSGGHDNPPLHALGTPNGVYRYGSSGFPASGGTYNYWVDVVVVTETGPDTTPPTVTTTVPVAAATDVVPSTAVSATFGEALDPATVNGTTFTLQDAAGHAVAADVAYDSATRVATLHPHAALTRSSVYRATVSGVTDLAGNALAADVTWTFTTAAPPTPPADAGPGGPVLVVADAGDPFGRYYGEILSTEGLNEYLVTDVSKVDATMLASYDVVILASMPLDAARVQMLSDWVAAGGNLVAMRPDAALASLAGLNGPSGTLADGYLAVDTTTAPGKGIESKTIQYHGTADRYTLDAATAVATLYSNATAATTNPAVTLRSVGTNGGHVAVFSYDLARSVVETRQGNPAWAGQKRDGQSGPIRSDDLFYGAASGDAQADWVNLDKVQIPQADEQQRLLVNMIESMQAQSPLPRLWYFPNDAKAVVVMTGDDHGSGGTAGRFDTFEADSAPGCVVDEWQCVRSTAYIYPSTPLTAEQAQAYQAAGFEVALHETTDCNNWTPESLGATYADQLASFAAVYPNVASPVTARTHCIAWSDWASQPKVELSNGIRLDTNYYYWPGAWIQDRPGLFTGSGIPMRFADVDGTTIDVFQAATQMTDESEQSYPATIDTLLANALGSNEYFGAFTANMHNDSADSAGANAIVASAQRDGVPVVSASQMLTWLDGRDASTFGAITHDGATVSFAIAADARTHGLRAMLPVHSTSGTIATLERGGSAVALTRKTINGVEYAFFDATSGSYTATYEADTTTTMGDTTVADFSAGTTGDATVVGIAGGGAVTLATGGAETFDGPGLPAGWSATTWNDGGAATATDGQLVVDGAQAGTVARYAAGQTLDFDATFSATAYQHAGFATEALNGPWAMFSTGRDGSALQARTNLTDNGASNDTTIPGNWIGTPHHYRIVWDATSVTYFIDGVQVASHSATITAPMRPTASDYNVGGGGISVDNVNLAAYAIAGTFVSRVFDAGSSVLWGALDADTTIPAGTSLTLSVRTGDTLIPDGTWTAWAPITSGAELGSVARYVQYSAAFSGGGNVTPSLLAVTLTYGPAGTVDHAPVARDDHGGTSKGSLLHVRAPGVLSNDTDADGDALQATLVAGPAHGTVELLANGSLDYRPTAGWTGTDSFTYTATDGTLTSNVATVTIGVVDTAPAAEADEYGTNVDTPLTVAAPGVLANDTDLDGDTLSATLVSGPAGGTLDLASDGSFTYVPAANENGTESFTYAASDGSLVSDPVTVTITITALPNRAPVATDDQFGTAEDTPLSAGVLGNDHDADGDVLSAALLTNPAHGVVDLGANGTFSYVPAANWSGTDHFTYAASDGTLTSSVATVTITVSAVNDAPVSLDDHVTTAEDTTLHLAAPGVLGNDTDVDGDALHTVLVTGPSNGTLQLAADGSFSYVPAANWKGTDSFAYSASDGTLTSNVATVTLVVTAVNHVPAAVDDHATTAEDAMLSAKVLGNDSDLDGDVLSATLVTNAAHGLVSLGANGNFRYTPNKDWNGTDHFTYTASDGSLTSAPAIVTIAVTPVNDAPVARAEAYAATAGRQLVVAVPGVLGNDTDVDGPALHAVLVGGPAHGTVHLAANGSFTYTATSAYAGADHFTYRATDGTLTSATTTVSLTVTVKADSGYWMVAADGGVFSFGDAHFYGSTGALHLTSPIVGLVATADRHGYWLVAADGGVFSFGDAHFYGSTGGLHVTSRIVAMAATPSGHGYWLVAADGGVFSFGDARFAGSASAAKAHIVGMAVTPTGHGYWLAAADGRVFAFGDARLAGSAAAAKTRIVGISATPTGAGYWLVAANGSVFAYGDAHSYGSAKGLRLTSPIVGMTATSTGRGYWLVAADGGIFSFGDARFCGSTGALHLRFPVVGMR